MSDLFDHPTYNPDPHHCFDCHRELFSGMTVYGFYEHYLCSLCVSPEDTKRTRGFVLP